MSTKRLRPQPRLDAERSAVAEIQRVAVARGAQSLSQSEFAADRREGSVSGIAYVFGSWNAAVQAAGLEPNRPESARKRQWADGELLAEIVRVAQLVGGPPSERVFARHARVSLKPYKQRWGSFSAARTCALPAAGP